MAVKLSKEVMEMVQTLLDVRNQLEDVRIDACHQSCADSLLIQHAADSSIDAIDLALDLMNYD